MMDHELPLYSWIGCIDIFIVLAAPTEEFLTGFSIQE